MQALTHLPRLVICLGVLLDEVIVRLVELAQFMLNISARVTVSLLDLTREGTEVSASDLVGAWKGCEGGPRPSGSPSWRHRCCSQGEEARPAPCKHRVDKRVYKVAMDAKGERLEGQRWGAPRLRSSELRDLVC